jgi:hypothetical protein
MLTSNYNLRAFLSGKCRGNIARPALGNKKFWIKKDHNLYKRDPYDQRLVKAIIIKVFGTVNEEKCNRYEERKGLFMRCTSIKAWINGCYSNYKKFNCYTQCSLINGFKKEQKLAVKINEGTEKVDAQTRSGRNVQKPAKYGQ